MEYLFIILGLVALYFGAEWLVSGAVAIARRFGISPLIASLVIVGFGTSLPELLISVRAAMTGATGLALGNVVGSNIANILLIIGVASVIYPISGWDRCVRRDAVSMTISAVVLMLLVQFHVIGPLAGVFLLVLLVLYLIRTYHCARGEAEHSSEPSGSDQSPLWRSSLLVLIGLASLLSGAELLIRGATTLAMHFGVSDGVIGLTVVALGTSYRTCTAIVAALRRQCDVAIGNVTGSCIFNTFCILGTTAIITPLPVTPGFTRFDVPVMLAASVFFTAMLFFAPKFHRATGVAMLIAYGAYTASLF